MRREEARQVQQPKWRASINVRLGIEFTHTPFNNLDAVIYYAEIAKNARHLYSITVVGFHYPPITFSTG
jgi:hypothetical protein